MRLKEKQELTQLIDEELLDIFEKDRAAMKMEAKKNIATIQEENKRTFNKRCKTVTKYGIDDLLEIKRTQFGMGTKLLPKFFGPYEIMSVKSKDRYE
jgi:hypothetical protein